jgi:digeranylgeranylglycerophospholipid reductase
VAVIGGGPAGLIAARQLSARGFSVRVFEEHDHIGSPVHCTGVLGVDAFAELDLPRRAIVGSARSARFISASGKTVVIDGDHVRAAVVDRSVFDRELAASARAAGAAIHTGVRVASLAESTEAVTVLTSAGSVRARSAVLACGASYRFTRALGLGLPRVLVHSAQLEVPFHALEHVEVHLGRRFAPGGFAWIVPFDRDGATFARIGLLCNRDAAAHFETFARAIRDAYEIEAPWPAARLKALPLAPIARTWTERILVVGDAAGLVKPTTGGGIYYGLLTGHLGAAVLGDVLRDDGFGGRSLKEYERRWRALLGPDIRAGLAFRAIAARLTDGAVDRLVELASVEGPGRLAAVLKQTADFNWHRSAASALLRHAEFRRIVLGAIWG